MSDSPKSLSWEEAVVWLKSQPDWQQLVRDAFYDDPLIAAAERYSISSEWLEISKLVSGRRGPALDVGAGRGIASYALARDGFEVTALEPDPSAVVGAAAIRSLARQAALPIRVVEDVSERLPFADATFDIVFARAVLHHTQNLGRACAEMHRVLRPGGVFIAAREHVISKASDLQSFLDTHPLHHLYGGENAYPLTSYIGALKKGGFDKIDVLAPLASPINLFPYTPETLQDAIAEKLSGVFPMKRLLRRIFHLRVVFRSFVRIAGYFDSRPGRLYSFVCYKARA